ncbi:hypothetical protein Tsubulata_011311 [Turnera subulata]|uniref:VQ domain-containing protein n=1 Tax=Turnera subulata TaxID=218843 RepID=A0A9Q0JE46_9ROSI|nr:hypothetical protein Tsubulata_011311 [Turnera subulata]
MDPPHYFTGGKPPHPPPPPQQQQHHQYHQPSSQPPPAPKKQVQLQGPRPTALKLHQDSHKIKKPPLPPPRQQPVIIYAVSPKVIHTEVSEFMSVVQRLTGLSSGNFSDDGAVSPAARLAATEKLASPREFMRPSAASSAAGGDGSSAADIMGMVEGLQVGGQAPGILSPGPAMLPPVPTGFFSPAADPSPSFFNDMSPFFSGASSGFMASPSSAFLSSNTIVSPLHSPDFFNLFMDL